jgi:hypothetical protein
MSQRLPSLMKILVPKFDPALAAPSFARRFDCSIP